MPDCPACAVLGKKAKEGISACENCHIELMEENRKVAQIYLSVQGQIITRFNGESDTVIDLNHLAIWEQIDRRKVEDPLKCFELIMRTFHHFLAKERGEITN